MAEGLEAFIYSLSIKQTVIEPASLEASSSEPKCLKMDTEDNLRTDDDKEKHKLRRNEAAVVNVEEESGKNNVEKINPGDDDSKMAEGPSMIEMLLGGGLWSDAIIKKLEIRDLATLYMTSRGCREISLVAAEKRTTLDLSLIHISEPTRPY